MLLDQVEAFADAGQHAEREHVDLEDAEFLDVVLVPFDEGAVLHRAIADGHGLGQRPFGQDEAADMLRQMARHADELLGELHRPLEVRVVDVEPGVTRAILGDLGFHAAPIVGGDGRADVFAQAHDLADFADRRARAVMDDRRGDPGAVAAVFVVDVLDHFLAPLMLEIDVDVGRLAALLGNEALEQQVAGRRVDRGDSEAVADGAVRGRCRVLGTGSADRGCARRPRCRGRSGSSARSRASRSASAHG